MARIAKNRSFYFTIITSFACFILFSNKAFFSLNGSIHKPTPEDAKENLQCIPDQFSRINFSTGVGLPNTKSPDGSTTTSADSSLPVPGVIIEHVRASDGYYIGSPSIVVLSNGHLIATNDFFGGSGARPRKQSMTRVHESVDNGLTWKPIADIDGQFSATLFEHKKDLYLIGISKGHGNIVINKSLDNGRTWSKASSYTTGILRKTMFYTVDSGYQTAPTPVFIFNNRIWHAMEDWGGPVKTFPIRYRTFMLSAPVHSNLLDSASWTMSNPMAFDSTYLNGAFKGWLEGNAIAGPDGQMYDVARVHTLSKSNEKAALIKISADGKTASFDPAKDFIDMPGGSKKFTIRFDSISRRYFALCNYVPVKFTGIKSLNNIRNTLALCSSTDLRNWKVDQLIIEHEDIYFHGYQYVDWQFQGNDIVAVSRTSHDDEFGGANTHHNSNYMTFHRVKNFRSLIK